MDRIRYTLFIILPLNHIRTYHPNLYNWMSIIHVGLQVQFVQPSKSEHCYTILLGTIIMWNPALDMTAMLLRLLTGFGFSSTTGIKDIRFRPLKHNTRLTKDVEKSLKSKCLTQTLNESFNPPPNKKNMLNVTNLISFYSIFFPPDKFFVFVKYQLYIYNKWFPYENDH